MSTIDKATADNIRAEIARRGLTQRDIAVHLGLCRSAVSHRLTGRTSFTLKELQALADLFNMNVQELLWPRSPVPSREAVELTQARLHRLQSAVA